MLFTPNRGAFFAGVLTGDHRITTLEALAALYGKPYGSAIVKEIDHINRHYRKFIEAAPFFALATSGPDGLDCSPRGDAGFRSRRRREDAAHSRSPRQ
jgi:hypothetical protein